MTRFVPSCFLVPAGIAALALANSASAQGFNNQWASFSPAPNEGDFSSTSSSNIEVDFAWADLDGDGWTDLVSVRKQPFTSTGKRTNQLFMNEGGILRDRSTEYASATDVPGDQGFDTPTNDRDVFIADFNLDGELDFVTATTLSDSDPKHVGHPRVYMNQGSTAGAWNGMLFEASRVPQLFHFGNGSARNPRFCSVAAGDLTGDGYPDMYFGDYDSGASSSSSNDLNDRLFINDGSAFFADESQSRMTTNMLKSAFGMASEIHDMNGDGANDIIKDTALNAPQYIAIVYNSPTNPGQFTGIDDFHQFAPYHVEIGDLNNDGRLDMISSDDSVDRWRLNEGNDAFGRVKWSGANTYGFLSGGDDGFGSNALMADVDGDGFLDTFHTDVDVDIPGSGRYMHIYHNRSTNSSNTELVEERAQSGNGWRGVVGITRNNLTDTHDVAVFDLDNDGDNDILIGRASGADVWLNDLDPEVCQTDLGFGGPGNTTLEICGEAMLQGNTTTISVGSDVPGAVGYLAVGNFNNPTPLFGGTVVPVPTSNLIVFGTNGSGNWSFDYTVTTAVTTSIFVQAAVIDVTLPELASLSNAVQADLN